MNIKKAYQYDKDGNFIRTWNTTTEAARFFGVDESSIRKAAKKERKSQGHYWSKYKFTNLFKPKSENLKFPKVLVFDIETAPLMAFVWRLKTRYVNPDMLEKSNWWVISWSAKWLFEDSVMSDVVTNEEAVNEDDSRVIHSIWNLINEADIVISHNGINFDHKLLNMRWLLHDMQPPAHYRVIDTYRSCRGLFDFPSYKLDFITKQLGIASKMEHEGFNMWRKSLLGDTEALANMSKYNDQDVKSLEELYLAIRPWIRNHPNLGVFMESEVPVCRVCGSKNLRHMEGHDYTTNLSKYETLRCECGAINKRRSSKLPLEVRKVIVSGMPA